MRHGIAYGRDHERWPDDSKRPLTADGEEKLRGVSAELAKAVPAPERLLSSPFERAWRTAGILREVAGWPEPEPMPALEGGVPPEKTTLVLGELAREWFGGPVAVVGHRSNIHEFASYLLTGDGERLGIKIKKGGLLCIRFARVPAPGSGQLRWLLTPGVILR